MGIFKRSIDAVYALRFLRLLILSWTSTDAYKLGIVDADGKKLKSPRTPEEKSAYTLFHRLVYNIKRLIQRLPGSLTRKLASWASALYLIKEHLQLDEKTILKELNIDPKDLNESLDEQKLAKNRRYTLNKDIPLIGVDEAYAAAGSSITISHSVGKHFGHTIYEATHNLTDEKVFVCPADIAQDMFIEEFSVTTQNVAMPAFPLRTQNGDIYRRFIVPTKLFQQFDKSRKKYQRWNLYLDVNDKLQTEIMEFGKKYRDATIILQDESTGAMRAFKPNSNSK